MFGKQQRDAFNKLKAGMTQNPVLKLYRVGAETELHTDACMNELGAVLLQKDADDSKLHPIYFASWKTSPTEENYTSFDLEMLAVVKASQKFRVYLLNIKFKIVTDCNAFVWTMKKKNPCLRVAHWILLIDQFKYTIERRPGSAMRHIDALSRNPVSVFAVQLEKDGLIEKLRKAQREDSELKSLIESVRAGKYSDFSLVRGDVLHKIVNDEELLVAPKSMQMDIIKQAHQQGHFGCDKTERLLANEFRFPRMRDKVQKVIANCVKCILSEKKQGKADDLLHSIEKEPYHWTPTMWITWDPCHRPERHIIIFLLW